MDGLKGLPDAIKTVFPDVSIQTCIVHKIRNSLKYIASKDQREFMKDLKSVYRAFTEETALEVSYDNVIFDGDSSYSNLIKDLFNDATHRRCIWHILRQLSHLLYMNKVPHKDREDFLYALIGILKNKDFYKDINEYFDFIQMFERLKFYDVASFFKYYGWYFSIMTLQHKSP